MATAGLADWMQRLHPLRLQSEVFSDANPAMHALGPMAKAVREAREPVAEDNPLLQLQKTFSQQIERSLEHYRELRDRASEALFHGIYGSPLVQALAGVKADDAAPRPRPGKDAAHSALVARRIDELTRQMPEGGLREAAIRALVYIRLAEGAADERGLEFLRRLRAAHGGNMTLAAFKQSVREQYFMLLLDEARAMAAIPAMLARDRAGAAKAMQNLRGLIEAVGLQTAAGKARLAEVEALFAAAGPARSKAPGGRVV